MRPRYRVIIGVGLLLGSLLAGAAAVELLEGRMPLKPIAIACLASGALLLGGDLLVRRISGKTSFWARYFGSEASLSLRGVLPLWVIGATLLVAGLSFPSP